MKIVTLSSNNEQHGDCDQLYKLTTTILINMSKCLRTCVV